MLSVVKKMKKDLKNFANFIFKKKKKKTKFI